MEFFVQVFRNGQMSGNRFLRARVAIRLVLVRPAALAIAFERVCKDLRPGSRRSCRDELCTGYDGMPRRVVRFATESLRGPNKVYGFLSGDVATISWSVEGCMQVRWVGLPMARGCPHRHTDTKDHVPAQGGHGKMTNTSSRRKVIMSLSCLLVVSCRIRPQIL